MSIFYSNQLEWEDDRAAGFHPPLEGVGRPRNTSAYTRVFDELSRAGEG